ncbi:hypothetical protein CDV36_012046 [Fusarium kuroshium]|uniref:Uncharacterized protein n=3 Tax=Fusarium solani species complex TaxID=232080 RepID=A0A3M2RSR0_9HYPO|nr:hypothetical protein CDV36_012046 [Fusarium kuroshium]RSL87756.1 hypothetical protein CEP52_015429 [Fusarium oligoseptatum]
MAQSSSPSLEPAFLARLYPAPDFKIGSTSNGEILNVVPISSGTVISEPGFGIPLDAEIAFGSDYVRINPSQSHARIHVNAILKNKDGTLVTYSYRGVIKMDAAFLAILSGSPDAKTTTFGNAVSHVTFQAGLGPLKELEDNLFVGSARFVVEDKGFFIETKQCLRYTEPFEA